jgi:hypothetical protein
MKWLSSLPWPLRALVVAAAVVLVLFGIAWAAVAILLPPARAKQIVQQQLARALSREVRFDGARVGILPPVRLTVTRPAISEPGGFARGAAFQARSLHLDLDVLALLGGRVVVRELQLDQPELHLVLRADGTTNFDGLVKPAPADAPEAKPMDFDVRALTVRDGQVLVDDLRGARRTALAIGTRLSLSSRRGGERVATSGRTLVRRVAFGPLSAARLADLNQALAKLEITLEHRGVFDTQQKRLALERVALGFDRAEIAVSGIVDDPGPAARIDLAARATGVDLGDVLDYLAAADAKALTGIRGSGVLSCDLRARGALGPGRLPELTGELAIRDGAFRYPGAPAGVDGVAFTARFAPDSLGIGDLQAKVAGQPVRAQLAMTRFADPYVVFALQGDVDLAVVAPMVAPKDTRIAGRAALDVRGRGPAKDPGALAVDGAAKLSNVSVESEGLPKKIEKVSGDIAFTQSSASVRNLAVTAGQSSLTLSGSVRRPLALLGKVGEVAPAEVRFDLRSPHMDLAELLPTTPGAPFLPNASGGGTVQIARLKNQKLDIADVRATVALEPAVLAVPEFSAAGYGGRVGGRARFDLTDTTVPRFDVKATVSNVQANDLLSAWTPAHDLLNGSLSTSIDLAGAGDEPKELARTLTAHGLAAITDGTLGPGPALEAIARFTKMPDLQSLKIRDGTLPFEVREGRVSFREAALAGPTGDWKIVGSVGFDGTIDYAVSTTIPPELVAQLGANAALAAGALADEQGRVLLDLRVTGPAKSPRVSWDRAAMTDRLAGRASQALEEQKRKLEQQARDAIERQKQAARDSLQRVLDRHTKQLSDSLKREAGGLLKDFFGGGRKDTAAVRDTTST